MGYARGSGRFIQFTLTFCHWPARAERFRACLDGLSFRASVTGSFTWSRRSNFASSSPRQVGTFCCDPETSICGGSVLARCPAGLSIKASREKGAGFESCLAPKTCGGLSGIESLASNFLKPSCKNGCRASPGGCWILVRPNPRG